jgi:orotidine-5'-phosphate decarboxylase
VKDTQKIIVALDVSSRSEALRLVKELHGLAGMFKVGSQLYMAAGPAIVREIVELGSRVFLDLKFHDIPNTVRHAAIEAARLGVSMMTIHAAGGRVMVESTMKGLQETFGGAKPAAVAITVLTSLGDSALREVGAAGSVDETVHRLALLAQECAMDGVVCSPREVQVLRSIVKTDFKLVTPGIRMPDQLLQDDQQRVSTPREAIAAGADYIVVGRPVTGEPDPRAALDRILRSL